VQNPITATVLITAAIIGAVIGGVTYVGINLYNGTAITWGGLAKSIITGAIVGAAGGYLSTFAPAGILPGAWYGAVTGSFTSALSSLFSGEEITLKGFIVGAILGGVTGAISGGIKAHKTGADLWSGVKTEAYTVEEFNKLNIIETSTKPKYSDATLNKMYKEKFQKSVSIMAGGDDKKALSSIITNNSGGFVHYDISKSGAILVKVDGVKVEALAVTRHGAFGRSSSVLFSRAAFNSTERLATVMAHELGHVTHNFLGLSALANQKWSGRKLGNVIDTEGHGAIYDMQYNFTRNNGFYFEAHIPDIELNFQYLKSYQTKLNTSIEYLSKIKMK
jgi:hypothetical protein